MRLATRKDQIYVLQQLARMLWTSDVISVRETARSLISLVLTKEQIDAALAEPCTIPQPARLIK
jgi:hypothetical protein